MELPDKFFTRKIGRREFLAGLGLLLLALVVWSRKHITDFLFSRTQPGYEYGSGAYGSGPYGK